MKHQAREARKAEVVSIWEQHYPHITVEKVCEMTGLSYRTIYRYLEESGQPLLPKQATRKIDMEKVKRAHELFSEHGNKSQVARIMGMSRHQIIHYLKLPVDDVGV